jgi:hypothetical protein
MKVEQAFNIYPQLALPAWICNRAFYILALFGAESNMICKLPPLALICKPFSLY